MKIVKKEGMKLETEKQVDIINKIYITKINDIVADKIIENTQGDIRRLVFILQDLKETYGNKMITLKLIKNYSDMFKLKDIDIDLYKATEQILYNYKCINDSLRLFETEKVIIPVMVHQYYIENLMANHVNKQQIIETAKTITDSLSSGDVIENFIYGDQNWDMQDIHGFYTCVIPSFNMTNNINPNYKRIGLKFAMDLNKTSIKKINKKTINNTNKFFNDMNIMDFIYINKTIRKYLRDNNLEGCVNLLKTYNINADNIEQIIKSLLKIDKINGVERKLATIEKKELINLIKK